MRKLLDRLGKGWKLSSVDDAAKGTQSEGNDAVRANLATYGDDGTAVRHVIHYAYPLENARPSEEVARYLEQLEFSVRSAETNDGLIFESSSEVASAAFDELTETMNRDLHSMNWDYDGWECAVVQKGEGTS